MADPSGKTDKELAAQFLGGDAAGFEGILAKYRKPVFSLILRMLGDRTRAEDVFQDVFIAVLRGLGGFNAGAPMLNWILQIAVNLCRNELRTARPACADPAGVPAPGPGPEHAAEASDLYALLQKGVLELSPEHREVLLLRMHQGLKYSEIGDILGISEGTAKSRIHYAVVNLRRFVKRHVKE